MLRPSRIDWLRAYQASTASVHEAIEGDRLDQADEPPEDLIMAALDARRAGHYLSAQGRLSRIGAADSDSEPLWRT